jgi:hypothetical protein
MAARQAGISALLKQKRLPGRKPKLIRRIIVKDIRNSSAVP